MTGVKCDILGSRTVALGQFPPRTIAPRTIAPGLFPPRIIATWAIPPGNSLFHGYFLFLFHGSIIEFLFSVMTTKIIMIIVIKHGV